MSLLDAIGQRESEQTVVVTESKNYTSDDVLRQIHAIRSEHANLEGQAVALHVSDTRSLAFYLLAFDGWVSSMAMLSLELGDDLQRLSDELSADHVIQVDRLPEAKDLAPLVSGSINTKWVIPTSGTTNVPKLVEHDIASLTSSLKKNTLRGKDLTWCLLYDLTRFAGLQVWLQAILGGSAIVLPKEIRDAESLKSLMNSSRVNALSATPSMWRKLLMQGTVEGLELRYITLGGEISDGNILQVLARKFGNARVTHVYASTEAGFGFSVKDGKPGFPALWSEESGMGVELKVEGGRLFLRKPEMKTQYVSSKDQIRDSEGWINTGDLVEKRGDRYVFLGRENGAINVGGQKVQPHEVETVLLSHESVLQAVVKGKPNPFMGNVVIAEVVSDHDSPELLKKELINLCGEALEDYKKPAIIKIVKELNLTAAGKIKR